MGDNAITKEELHAMLEVQAKTAEQMTIIAQRLQTLLDGQEKIIDSLPVIIKEQNATIEKMVDTHLGSLCTLHTNCSGEVKTIAKDTFWIKIILGSATLIFAIAILLNNAVHWFFHVPKGAA